MSGAVGMIKTTMGILVPCGNRNGVWLTEQ